MLVAPFAVWAGATFGPRLPLKASALAFSMLSLAAPFSPNLSTLLVLQFASGLSSGFFIPLTLSFILRNLPPRFWAYGVALYSLSLDLSLNISASIEGWMVDHLTWHWIFWQEVPLGIVMAGCLHFGVPSGQPSQGSDHADIFGLVFAGAGLAMIYAGLDQGNRLDWFNSGEVTALLAAGTVLLIAFVLQEVTTDRPLIDVRFALTLPMPALLLMIGLLRVTLLATSFLIPQYLQAVRGYRALEIGQTLIWIAAPQLLVCWVAAVLLRRLDARLVSALGFALVSLACLSVAGGLTPDWGSDQFLPSQLVQALGQSLALSGVMFFGVLHLRPDEALTFGAGIQTARVMGGEIGLSCLVTLTRVRAQAASNTLGQHVSPGDSPLLGRLAQYAGIVRHADGDVGAAAKRAVGLLGNAVHTAAATQSVIDSFIVLGGVTALAVVLTVVHKAAPLGPASHVPLFSRGRKGGA